MKFEIINKDKNDLNSYLIIMYLLNPFPSFIKLYKTYSDAFYTTILDIVIVLINLFFISYLQNLWSKGFISPLTSEILLQGARNKILWT